MPDYAGAPTKTNNRNQRSASGAWRTPWHAGHLASGLPKQARSQGTAQHISQHGWKRADRFTVGG